MATRGEIELASPMSGSYYGKISVSWVANQNIDGNYSDINYTIVYTTSNSRNSSTPFGNVTVQINNETVYSIIGNNVFYTHGYVIDRGVVTVHHNVDGTASLSVSASAKLQGRTSSASDTWAIDTIPRGSVPTINSQSASVESVTIGDAITIYTNKKANYTHKVSATFGTKTVVISQNCVDSVTWNDFTVAGFASQIPNAVSGTLKITVETMNGNTRIGTATASVVANLPSSVVPTCSATIANSDDTFEGYVQNLSAVQVTPTANGVYGSTLKSVTISVTDMTTSIVSGSNLSLINAGSYTHTSEVFKKTGVKVISVVAVDSRNRSTTWATSITVSAYQVPTANVSASRGTGTSVNDFIADDTGNKALITVSGSVSNIAGNTLTPELEYRVAPTGITPTVWNSIPISVESGSLTLDTSAIISTDDDKSYEIRLTITDASGTSTKSSMTLSNGYATLDFYAGGNGIAFGKTANRPGFDCAMLTRMLKGVTFTSDASGYGGWTDWCYNSSGDHFPLGHAYADINGFHIKHLNFGDGYLEGTWKSEFPIETLSDMRTKKEITPIDEEIIKAIGEVPFRQFRMSTPGGNDNDLMVGIIAQDLHEALQRHGIDYRLKMLGTMRPYFDGENDYYCVDYTNFLIVRLLYDELKIEEFEKRLAALEEKLK